MTPTTRTPVDRLTTRAEAAGLHVLARSTWPDPPTDTTPPPIPGFVISTFSPLAAATAARCLTRALPPVAGGAVDEGADRAAFAPAALPAGSAGNVPAAVDPVRRGSVSDGVAAPVAGGAADEGADRAALAAAAAVDPGSGASAGGPMAGGSATGGVAASAASAAGFAGQVPGAVAPAEPGAGGSAAGRVAAPAAPTGSLPGLASRLAAGRTAVVVVSAYGDVVGARHVAGVVDRGGRPGPLMFFQAVPNAVAGHVALRWGLEGAVVCVGDVGGGVEVARGLIEDGDADEVLVVWVEQLPDRAEAVLVAGGGGEWA